MELLGEMVEMMMLLDRSERGRLVDKFARCAEQVLTNHARDHPHIWTKERKPRRDGDWYSFD